MQVSGSHAQVHRKGLSCPFFREMKDLCKRKDSHKGAMNLLKALITNLDNSKGESELNARFSGHLPHP